MGAVRRPCPQPQQRIVCIRSEEPPKNRARFLGLIGQSSWRYLPDYTRHLWPIKDELGTATWLVKGRPEGSRRDNIAPSRRVYRTRISPLRQRIVRACRGRSHRPDGSVRVHCTLFEPSADRMVGSAIAEEGIPHVAAACAFLRGGTRHGVKPRKVEGTWSLGVRAGDFVFVAGMQGIDPATNTLVQDPQARIRQAFLNIRLIAQSEGASLQDCVRVTVYVSDLHRYAAMVDKAQAELWGKPPYPPRTMIEVQRLFDDDIVEIDSVFYAPMKK